LNTTGYRRLREVKRLSGMADGLAANHRHEGVDIIYFHSQGTCRKGNKIGKKHNSNRGQWIPRQSA